MLGLHPVKPKLLPCQIRNGSHPCQKQLPKPTSKIFLLSFLFFLAKGLPSRYSKANAFQEQIQSIYTSEG